MCLSVCVRLGVARQTETTFVPLCSPCCDASACWLVFGFSLTNCPSQQQTPATTKQSLNLPYSPSHAFTLTLRERERESDKGRSELELTLTLTISINMADLNNLLSSINHDADALESPVLVEDERQEQVGPENEQDELPPHNNVNDTNEPPESPHALAEAAAEKRRQQEAAMTGDTGGFFGTFGGTMSLSQKNHSLNNGMDILDGHDDENNHGEDQDYSHLKRLWVQEMLCPELLPYDQDTISMQAELVEGQHESVDRLFETASQRDANLASLIGSIYKADADRVQYMVSDLLSTRLGKIEEHPLHMREKIGNMSQDEVGPVVIVVIRFITFVVVFVLFVLMMKLVL